MIHKFLRMNKLFLPVVALILLFSGFFFFAPTAVAQDTDKIAKIGLLNPETGVLSGYAQGFENAFNLALAKLNETEGWGFTSAIEDTGTGDNTKTTAAADALVSAGVAGVVGAAASSSSITALAKFKAEKISQISYASTSPALSNATLDDGYFFRVVPSDALQGVELSNLLNERNVTKVGVIHLDDAYGTGLANGFKAHFEARSDNHSVVIESSYDQSSFTASDVVSPIVTNADKIEAVILITFITDGAAILGEIDVQTSLDDIPLFTGDGLASDTLFDEASANETDAILRLRGLYAAFSFNDTRGSNFTADLMAAYGTTPDFIDREVYDATLLLGQAIITANPADPASITDAERDTIRDEITRVSKYITGTATGNLTLDEVGDRIVDKHETWQVFLNTTTDELYRGTPIYEPATTTATVSNTTGTVSDISSNMTSNTTSLDPIPFGVLPFIGTLVIISVGVTSIISFRRRT